VHERGDERGDLVARSASGVWQRRGVGHGALGGSVGFVVGVRVGVVVIGTSDSHGLQASAGDAEVEDARRGAVEGRVLCRGPGRRRRREGGVAVVTAVSGVGAGRGRVDGSTQSGETVEEVVDLGLQMVDMGVHALELVRVFEAVAAVGRVQALEGEVAAALARRLPIALDLSPLTLVTRN